MANQIVQLGRRVLNANRVSCSVNFFRSPNRFGHRHISRLVKPNTKGAFDEDALAREEHQKTKRGKLLCELRDITNKFNNKLDNIDQEERERKTIDYEIAKLRRERRDIFNELNNLNNTVDQEERQKKKMELEKLRCELREVINKLINNLDQEELVSERVIKTIDNEIAKLHRERWGNIFKELARDSSNPDLHIRNLSWRIRHELEIQNLYTTNHNNESEQGTIDNAVYIAIRKLGWKLRDIFNGLINLNNTVDQEEHQKKKMELEKLHCELRDVIDELVNNVDQVELVSERDIKTIVNAIAELCISNLSWRIRHELAIQNSATTANHNNKSDQMVL